MAAGSPGFRGSEAPNAGNRCSGSLAVLPRAMGRTADPRKPSVRRATEGVK